MSTQLLTDQLHSLLRCRVCEKEKTNHKQLPCQHTLCEECLEETVGDKTTQIECPIPSCAKICVVPNGGAEGFPDSLVTKQMADILKFAAPIQPRETAIPNTKSPPSEVSTKEVVLRNKPTEDEKVKELLGNSKKRVQLRKELERLAAKAQSWIEHTKVKMGVVSHDLSELPLSCQMAKQELQTARDKLKAEYQMKLKELDAKTKDKIDDIQKHRSDREEEIECWLRETEPKLCQVLDVLKDGEEVLKGIRTKSTDAVRLERALTKVSLLKSYSLTKGNRDWNEFHTGDSCRLKVNPENEADNLLSSRTTHSQIGRLARFENLPTGVIWVEVVFPGMKDNQSNTWSGELCRISKSLKESSLPFVDFRVKFANLPATKPKHTSDEMKNLQKQLYSNKTEGWLHRLQLHPLALGKLNVVIAKVGFPNGVCWTGLLDELERVEGDAVKPGDRVWIHRAVIKPSHGFNGVTRSSCGVVTSINRNSDDDDDIVVNFPECSSWRGKVSELRGENTPFENEAVQVSLHTRVGDTKKWKGITHDDVGTLEKIRDGFNHKGERTKLAVIKFEDKSVECELTEIEPAMVSAFEEKQAIKEKRKEGSLKSGDEGKFDPALFHQIMRHAAEDENLRRLFGGY